MERAYTREEKEILEDLEAITDRALKSNRKYKFVHTEYLVLDEEKACWTEDDLLNGIIDDATATKLEIKNSSFYAILEILPSHIHKEKEQKIGLLFWQWVWGKIEESVYRRNLAEDGFLILILYLESGTLMRKYS